MKKGEISIFFSVQGTGGSTKGPDPENREGIRSLGKLVSSELQVPGEPGRCRARTRALGELPAAFPLQNLLQSNLQGYVILRVEIFVI
jgi:hypothetical protein